MATSKTLTPTNVTIQIPAFTEKPDQRVNSNCIDKEADAINALSDQIGNLRHLAPKSIVTGISIANNDTFAIGSVVVCNIRFATTQAINANNVIMALPAPRNSNSSGASSSLVGVMLKKTDGTEYNASVLMEGNVYLTEQIPSGVNCLLSIVYAAKESSITSFIGS